MWRGRPPRPPRAEVERAALDILQRRGGEILAAARKHAATPDDAEDAYQRGLEILLGKAPSTDEDELVPWLKTVVMRTIGPSRRRRGVAATLPLHSRRRTVAPRGSQERRARCLTI